MSSTEIAKNVDPLESGKGADLIVKSGNEEFCVHRSIMIPRSDVIASTLEEVSRPENPFLRTHSKKIQWNEAVYELDDDEPDTVRRVIRFLYIGEYDDTETATFAKDQGLGTNGKGKGKEELRPRADSEVSLAEVELPGFDIPSDEEADDTEARMMVHVKVYSLAEHLKINDLKEYARAHFETLAIDYWPYENLPEMIHSVYASTPAWDVGLRSTMIDVCVAHYEELMLAGNVLGVMAQYGDLAVEVMREVVFALQQEIRGLRASRRSGNGIGDKGKGKMASVKNALREIEEGEE